MSGQNDSLRPFKRLLGISTSKKPEKLCDQGMFMNNVHRKIEINFILICFNLKLLYFKQKEVKINSNFSFPMLSLYVLQCIHNFVK